MGAIFFPNFLIKYQKRKKLKEDKGLNILGVLLDK
jgi:hypothetical protein